MIGNQGKQGKKVLDPKNLDFPSKFDLFEYTKPIRVDTSARAYKTVISHLKLLLISIMSVLLSCVAAYNYMNALVK